MNKKQLVAKISSNMNLSKADAERTFDSITNIILDALKNDDQVKIAGFGTYKVAKEKLEQEEIQELVKVFKFQLLKKSSFYPQKHLRKCLINKLLKTALFC